MLARLRLVADRMTEAAAALILLGLLTVIILGVASRTAGAPLIWTDELARYLMIWLAFLGWIIAARRRNHIRITILIDRLPNGSGRYVEAAIQALVALFGTLLGAYGFGLIAQAWDVASVSMRLTSAVIYLLLPLAGGAIALQALAQAAEALLRNPALKPEVAKVTGGKIL